MNVITLDFETYYDTEHSLAHLSAVLKEFGLDTAFVVVVREALDVTYEIPDWDLNPFNPNKIPF